MKKVLSVFLVAVALLSLVSCSAKLDWPDGKLGSMIPQIDGAKGEVSHESLDSLRITLENISESQYLEYVQECKNKGFSVDISEDNNSFVAFTEDGYKIDVSYLSRENMWITVDAPIEMAEFNWPGSEIAKLLPKPSSNYGKIEWEAEYGFVIYVGNTTRSDYNDYVDAVYELGFTVDYSRGDDYFYADNAEGYSVSLKYEGFNTMFVRIDEPDEEEDETTAENADFEDVADSNTAYETDEAESSTEVDTDENVTASSNEPISGIRPEFKDAMDSYEAFFNEYCEFMKEYTSSEDAAGMMGDYISFLSRYADAMKKLDEISESEMSEEEMLYYTEVMARITQKLLELN